MLGSTTLAKCTSTLGLEIPSCASCSYRQKMEKIQSLKAFHSQCHSAKSVSPQFPNNRLASQLTVASNVRLQRLGVFIFAFSPTGNEQSAVSVTCWGTRHHLYPGQTSQGFCCQKHHPFNGDESGRGQSAYRTAERWAAEQRASISNDYLLAEHLDAFGTHVLPLNTVRLCAVCFCCMCVFVCFCAVCFSIELCKK